VPGTDEIDAILATTAAYLDPAPTRREVTAMFCGLRPLAGSGGQATARVSREHVLVRSHSGLVTITGGKWTTFRRMAEETIDFALAGSALIAGPSRTARQGLVPATPPANDTPLPGLAYGEEACRQAVRVDYARRTEDILARRCRALFTDVDAALAAAPRVAAIVGAELGRDAAAVAADLAAFTALAARYSLHR
jgi:glycerol-3-phosphate dehydrogenase